MTKIKKIGEEISWYLDSKTKNIESGIYTAKISIVNIKEEEYGVYASYGQDLIPFNIIIDKTTCGWKSELLPFDSECYRTDCDNLFQFDNGTPEENGFKYCPYCSKKIQEVKWL